MSKKLCTITLPERLEAVLLGGHPWVFAEQFQAPKVASGTWVRLSCGKFEGYALFAAGSPLALRVFSRTQVPDDDWIAARLSAAWELRTFERERFDTNAFRWVNGEGDYLPGVIVDYYAGYAVLVLDSPALRGLAESICRGLLRVTDLKGVCLRDRDGDSGTRLSALHGRLPPRELIVVESGLRFVANTHAGQKTGLFLDHRENRRLIECFAKGRRVLNLFSYSGAFSLYALRGGAAQVTSVDSAPAAALDAQENVRLNGLDAGAHEVVVSDVFEYLEHQRLEKRQFDLVVCDPPSFARNQKQLKKALSAYARVNAAGMKVVSECGLYAAASCTARVTPEAFRHSVAGSARRAQRGFQLIQEVGHASDHPHLAGHPEGRYLKFLLGRLSQRV